MNTIESTVTREEWAVTFDGERLSVHISDRDDALDYINRGVEAGNAQYRYGIVRREVVSISTRWEDGL